MKTKAEPKVEQSIKVTLEGKTVELTKSEATSLFNDLKKALNISDTIVWPSPVVVERPVYVRPHYHWDTIPNTPYSQPYKVWCNTSQAVSNGVDRVYNLANG